MLATECNTNYIFKKMFVALIISSPSHLDLRTILKLIWTVIKIIPKTLLANVSH